MKNKRDILLFYSLFGACIGYFVLHPLVMLISFLMTHSSAELTLNNSSGIAGVVRQSFSLAMLPWSVSFTLLTGVIGFYYGMFKVRRIEREKLIANLQKALADVKTLSGLLPICAWCKKIRSDKGYWENIEAYMKSHLNLDFTHGICSDCAKKEYPELYCTAEDESKKSSA